MSHPSELPIVIDTQAPITINSQIAEQIKLLIAIEYLHPGDALPTVTQLAKSLGVNHNTIASVYNCLVEAGYLTAQRGKGTFIAHTQVVHNIVTNKQFYNLIGQAFMAAKTVGLSPSEFGVAAYAKAVMLNRSQQAIPLNLVFVEQLQHGRDVSTNVYEDIQSTIRHPVSFLDLEEVKTQESRALKELLAADLVITTGEHQWEVSQLTAPEQEVIAVHLKPDIKLLTQISSLPRHTKMLLVAQEEAGCEKMQQMLEAAGISHVSFYSLDIGKIVDNPQVLSDFDVVCASKLVNDSISQYNLEEDKVFGFNFCIDESNLSVLKARVSAILSASSPELQR